MVKKPPIDLGEERGKRKKSSSPTPEERKNNLARVAELITHGARIRRTAKPKVKVTVKGAGVEITDENGEKK
jgi:hypothetical protein